MSPIRTRQDWENMLSDPRMYDDIPYAPIERRELRQYRRECIVDMDYLYSIPEEHRIDALRGILRDHGFILEAEIRQEPHPDFRRVRFWQEIYVGDAPQNMAYYRPIQQRMVPPSPLPFNDPFGPLFPQPQPEKPQSRKPKTKKKKSEKRAYYFDEEDT